MKIGPNFDNEKAQNYKKKSESRQKTISSSSQPVRVFVAFLMKYSNRTDWKQLL
jgi:hypothetical protein